MNAPMPNAPEPLLPVDGKGVRSAREIPFLADGRHGPDLLEISEAIQPIVELVAHRDSQTPMMIAVVGPSGAGKSFTLGRIAAGVEALRAAAKTVDGPFVSQIVTVSLDAAAIATDPAAHLAAATYAALCRDNGDGGYAALADEAAHAGADPHLAASKAAERHDEARRRLDAERQARDETEARRARLSDVVLFETPGSRVDAYARASRGRIEARLRRFELLTGEPTANFKELVRDFAGAGAGSRLGLALRSIWAYRRQSRLLLGAIVFFLLALAVSQARGPIVASWLKGLSAGWAADWIAAHGDWMDYAITAFLILGGLALALNLWRAFIFTASLYRGVRLLNYEVRERGRELDAASARLNQRVASLSAEAEAAARHAEAADRRAKLRGPVAAERGPAPMFLDPTQAPQAAARAFFAALDRAADGQGEAGAPPVSVTPNPPAAVPKRIVLVIDNLDALSPAQALQAIETARSLFGRAFVGLFAFDPRRLAAAIGDKARLTESVDKLFQIVFNAGRVNGVGGERLVARLLGGAAQPSRRAYDARQSILGEPIGAAEGALLTALAPFAAATPRGVKRYLNIYRLARVGATSKAAVALALAVEQGGDDKTRGAFARLIAENPDGAVPEPLEPPALVAAMRAARASGLGALRSTDLVEAQALANRYQLGV
ncbi:MAG TPA: P-loop NTPase fold protein [Roseiarcus sp.]|nr:P-loop NTPase fold protein [Roseiarcus sp.]